MGAECRLKKEGQQRREKGTEVKKRVMQTGEGERRQEKGIETGKRGKREKGEGGIMEKRA